MIGGIGGVNDVIDFYGVLPSWPGAVPPGDLAAVAPRSRHAKIAVGAELRRKRRAAGP
jgi:hypothetical protein